MIAAVALLALAPVWADDDNDRDGWPESEDCDDAEDRVNPGEDEDCADGLDNDCDGYTDDLDADCHPAKEGCAVAPSGGAGLAALGGLLVSARRRPGPRGRSSRRCRA